MSSVHTLSEIWYLQFSAALAVVKIEYIYIYICVSLSHSKFLV